jgi:beta-lactamase regulating signal transducer with metallopeptidase domain/protocatechuate 3,4-dioxygenase beta subunit
MILATIAESLALWLADYYLLSIALLGAALLSSRFLNQPSQRLAIAKATIVALFLLALLCAIPGWSLVHLIAAKHPRANDSQAAPLKSPSIADLPDIPAAGPIDTESLAISPPASQQNVPQPTPQSARNWRDFPWPQIVVLAHSTGTACVIVWLVLGAVTAHRLQCSAQPASPDLLALFTEVAALQNRSSCLPELKVSDRIGVAVALGIRRPTVLIPKNWLKSHAPDQLRMVLAHELAHVANHDLRWLAASRALLMLLWAQPLLWLMRHRMRLEQESLADAAAAELTSRQQYAEQLVDWARRVPARSTLHLSAAVGLWERPSQLRQRISLLVAEHFTVLRECSPQWRLASVLACTFTALGLSFVTLQPPQSHAQDTESEQAVTHATEIASSNDSDPLFVDDRFILCRVRTDLQRSLLGDISEPAANASLCVFVNYARLADEPLNSRSPSLSALSDQLKRFAQDDNRYVLMKVMVAQDAIGSEFEKVQERAQALAKLCEEVGRDSGYKRAKWSTTFGVDDWKTFTEQVSPALKVTGATDESPVGDKQVQVFPVRTPLSRLLVKADCVINILPVVRHKQGTRFPDDFVPALMKFVPQLKYQRMQVLLIRVRYVDTARDRLDEWVNDRAGREAFAEQLGFETCNLQQSFTDEPEGAADLNATSAQVTPQPVEIPIIVARHVLLHDGRIIEWADLERIISALPKAKLAQPGFYFTAAAGAARQEEVRTKIWDLRRKVPIHGHSWGSISPRTSPRYDSIRTADDLAPNDAWRVNGTVETADGLPIDGAEVVLLMPVDESIPYKILEVYLRNERLREPIDEVVTTSDNSGRFAVYPRPETPYYLVALHREGFGLIRSDAFARSQRITIQPWAHLRGAVKQDARFKQSASHSERVPADGRWPEITFHQYSEDLGPASPDGRFEFAFVPPNLPGTLSRSIEGEQGTSYGLPATKFKLSPAETLTVDLEPPGNEEAARIEVLKSADEQRQRDAEAARAAEEARQVNPSELAGRVVSADGNPLSGVVVDVWTWHVGNETVTDADGRFTLSGFDDREVIEVQFTKPGYGPVHFAAQQTGQADWTVTLANDTYLEGRVLGPDGKPVPRARIRAARGPFENPQVHISEVWTETGADADGRYRMYFEPGSYDIHVRVPGVGLARLQNTSLSKEEKRQLDIQLRTGPTFRAQVLDMETNEPVAGIRLWNSQQQGIEGVSDASGLITIENMTPGPFEFDVTAVGEPRGSDVAGNHARWWSPDTVDENQQKIEYDNSGFQRNFDGLSFNIVGNTEPVIIYVEKAVSIRGRVVDPEGFPVPGATVAPALTGSGNSITGDTRYSVTTVGDGTFHMRLPASNHSKYNLVAHDGGYQEWRRWANGIGEVLQTRPGQELSNFELQLTRPGVVRGRVVDGNGKPIRNHRVRTQSADYRENRYYNPETRTNDSGEFELKFVRPGEHFVQADPFWLVDNEAESESSRRITVEAGKTVDGIELIHRPAESRPPIDHILPGPGAEIRPKR